MGGAYEESKRLHEEQMRLYEAQVKQLEQAVNAQTITYSTSANTPPRNKAIDDLIKAAYSQRTVDWGGKYPDQPFEDDTDTGTYARVEPPNLEPLDGSYCPDMTEDEEAKAEADKKYRAMMHGTTTDSVRKLQASMQQMNTAQVITREQMLQMMEKVKDSITGPVA